MRIREPDALSRDAAAARAAGLSYGKYKALQNEAGEHKIDPKREKVPVDVKVCPVCGCLFLPRHKNKIYCDDVCKSRATEARRRERNREAEK